MLVIGAGPSGTVAASILNQSGAKVKIVEKQRFPRFVIGESLLPRCMDNLEAAGFIDIIEQAGFQKKFGAKFEYGWEACNFSFSEQFTKGWSWTWQVQRGEFDHILAKEVEKRGVDVEYESEVVAVELFDDGTSNTQVKRKDGSEYSINAKFIVDASGYGRVLPRLLDLDQPSDFPTRASLFCHLEDLQRPTGIESKTITIIVYNNDIWLWVIPFSDGTTSIGITGTPEVLNQFEGDNSEQFDQWIQEIVTLKDRFRGAKKIFEARKISGYAAAVKQLYGNGYVLTGNSSEFLDPVFSSGVTFATESGALAGKLIAKGLNGEDVDWETDYSKYIKRGVDVFRTFVTEWYSGALPKIFFNEQPDSEIKNQICSILAGYVWDLDNPMVKKHSRAIKALAHFLG